MKKIVTLLQRLGFGEYEAKTYVTLLKHNPLNGYELAKASGLPRANVYAVLQKLEERSAAGLQKLVIDTAAEFCQSKYLDDLTLVVLAVA